MRWNRLTGAIAGLAGAALLLSLPAAARADGGPGDARELEIGGYHLHLDLPDPVITGNTPVVVTVLDDQGQPISGAKVRIVAVLAEPTEDEGHGHGASGGPAVEDAHIEPASDEHASGDGGHDDAAADDAHTTDHDATANDEHAADGASSEHDESEPHEHLERHVFEFARTGEPGIYRGGVIFLQTGHWAGQVELVIDGQLLSTDVHIEVVPPDPGRAVLATFLGLNVTIVGAAAVIKRKTKTIQDATGVQP